MSEHIGVYKAIAKVTAAMASEGISKERKNQQQGYAFRGIDDVYNALSRMLADAGLCIIPRILSRHVDERQTKSGGALFYVTVDAEYDLVSADDGSKHTAKVFGEAMDSADKATNKAMSAAYKYMAFQTFAIPTEGDNDADSHTPSVAPKSPVKSALAGVVINEEDQAYLRELAAEIVEAVEGFEGTAAKGYDLMTNAKLDGDQKLYLWSVLQPNSKVRAALKKEGDVRKAFNAQAAKEMDVGGEFTGGATA